MSSSSSSVEQKKNETSDEGASPSGAKKPDWIGFSKNLGIGFLRLMIYAFVSIIGLYTIKTVVARTSTSTSSLSCSVNLFGDDGSGSGSMLLLPNCKTIEFGGATVPLGKSAQTSAVARYFHKVFRDVFSTNTFIMDSYCGLLGELPNLGALIIYGLLSIPFLIVLWLCNWLTNVGYGLYNLSYLFSEPCENKGSSGCSGGWKRQTSFLSWKIIPVALYVCFIGITTFFASLYTTVAAILGPLFLKFVQNRSEYGFGDLLKDVLAQYRVFWTILFGIIMVMSANSYLGGVYTGASVLAVILTFVL